MAHLVGIESPSSGGGGAVTSVNSQTGAVVLAAADVGAQPVDSDLTAIAALSTTAFGRSFLDRADAAAGRTLLGLGTAATTAASAYDAAGAAAAAQAASQPLDSDLTAIAALTTTTFGRALLAMADAAATKTALALVAADVGLGNVDNTADASKSFAASQITSGALAIARGGTAQGTALAARGSSGLNIEGITLMTDAALVMTASDRNVYTSVTFTASRTITLPAANAVNKGTYVFIADAFSAVNGAFWLTIQRAGTDTIDTTLTSLLAISAKKYVLLQSDGVSNWVQIVPLTLPISQGGTGQPSKASAFDALSPQTTRGDLIIENATPSAVRLAIGPANSVLRSNGTDPAWSALTLGSMMLVPTGAIAQTVPRHNAGTNSAALVSAQLQLDAIWLPKDTTITSITFVSGTTALSVGLNQWFVLADSALAKLQVTADDTSTAWAANSPKTLTLASTFKTTYEGLHYIGIMVKATTPPSLVGLTSTVVTKDLTPILSGLSTAALTNPASCPSTLGAIASGQTITAYAYVS